MKERVGLAIYVEALEENEQLQWCHRVITDTVEKTAGIQVDGVEFHKRPPISKDMRRLETWRMSVGYHASQMAAQVRTSKVRIAMDDAGEDKILVRVANEENGIVCDRLLTLVDGIFAIEAVDAKDDRARIELLTQMSMECYLQPCVMVSLGKDIEGFQKMVEESYHRYCQGEMVVERVELFTEGDREQFFGDMNNPVLTGVFRRIDQVTNPIYDRENDCIVFFIRTNAYGCFSMRELIESGKSRTHRTAIDKKRVTFILQLDDSNALSDQIYSRSHGIFISQ